jgi:hypothetical protein
MRNVALFTGGSVTFGLGLEIELRPKYNDDKWLKENGLILPLEREDEDKIYWKSNRYSKLVSDELGLIEYNVHDHYDSQIGGCAIDTLWIINRNESKFSSFLETVKYVFIEIGFVRWWDENIHGMTNENKFPTTINEILNFINNPDSDYFVTSNALDWLNRYDADVYWEESFNRFNELKTQYPEITFIILPWSVNDNNNVLNEKFDRLLKNQMISFENGSIFEFLKQNKLLICDVAKAYNGDYKYNLKDEHPSSRGHKKIAERIIDYIQNGK